MQSLTSGLVTRALAVAPALASQARRAERGMTDDTASMADASVKASALAGAGEKAFAANGTAGASPRKGGDAVATSTSQLASALALLGTSAPVSGGRLQPATVCGLAPDLPSCHQRPWAWAEAAPALARGRQLGPALAEAARAPVHWPRCA